MMMNIKNMELNDVLKIKDMINYLLLMIAMIHKYKKEGK